MAESGGLARKPPAIGAVVPEPLREGQRPGSQGPGSAAPQRAARTSDVRPGADRGPGLGGAMLATASSLPSEPLISSADLGGGVGGRPGKGYGPAEPSAGDSPEVFLRHGDGDGDGEDSSRRELRVQGPGHCAGAWSRCPELGERSGGQGMASRGPCCGRDKVFSRWEARASRRGLSRAMGALRPKVGCWA